MKTSSDMERCVARRSVLSGAMAAVAAVCSVVKPVAARTTFRTPSSSHMSGAMCGQTSTGVTPLTDLGVGAYKGFQGGLYSNGMNQPPTAYAQTGRDHASRVEPIDADGHADSDGKIVLLSIGMSNTTMEFSAFKTLADADPRKNSRLMIVDGAEGGQDAEKIKDPTAPFWSVVTQRLHQAGAIDAQVQAIWLKEAISRPSEAFPADAQRLQRDLAEIVTVLTARFSRLQLVYLSSRTYGGYASTSLNPEPYAYESGFAVKWLIADRAGAEDVGPWLGWGPYLWTDGTTGRSDGLIWTCDDVRPNDGTHPSASGRMKVARLLLTFFTSDATAKPWFVAS